MGLSIHYSFNTGDRSTPEIFDILEISELVEPIESAAMRILLVAAKDASVHSA